MTEALDARPFVSVIIPVYDDEARLRLCLRALEAQTYPTDRFEVIVVDNGSPRPLAPVKNDFPHARFTTELLPGSYAARNRGILLARGDPLAFTDSDCIPTPTWIEHGVRWLHAHPGAGLVGGKIQVFYRDAAHPTLTEQFSSIASRRQRENVEIDHFSETANLFTNRAIVNQVGPFDARLKSRGDVLWGQRLFARGYPLLYADDACVLHPAIRTPQQLYRRTLRLAGGRHDIRRLCADPHAAATRTSSLDPGQFFVYVLKILRNPRFNPHDRPALILLLTLVQLISLSERLRLRLGGTSRR